MRFFLFHLFGMRSVKHLHYGLIGSQFPLCGCSINLHYSFKRINCYEKGKREYEKENHEKLELLGPYGLDFKLSSSLVPSAM